MADSEPAESLEDLLHRMAREPREKVSSGGFYSLEADCMFFYNKDAQHFSEYAEYIDGFLTIYRARKDERVIGFRLSGIKILAEDPMIDLVVQENYQAVYAATLVTASYYKAMPEAAAVALVRAQKYSEVLNMLIACDNSKQS